MFAMDQTITSMGSNVQYIAFGIWVACLVFIIVVNNCFWEHLNSNDEESDRDGYDDRVHPE